ncbi:MAG: His/Gly/Thr/Pro-type tRNA ligase C-terminal domain-containing protein, partial [Acidimicrobiales bacterium]
RRLTSELRGAGVRCDRGFDQKAMRAQMKAADRSGASHAVIIGEQELADATASVRPLRGEFGADQESVARTDLVAHLVELVAKEKP